MAMPTAMAALSQASQAQWLARLQALVAAL
jgi:hypothetical protein